MVEVLYYSYWTLFSNMSFTGWCSGLHHHANFSPGSVARYARLGLAHALYLPGTVNSWAFSYANILIDRMLLFITCHFCHVLYGTDTTLS